VTPDEARGGAVKGVTRIGPALDYHSTLTASTPINIIFQKMLRFSKKKFFKEENFVKEIIESLGIFHLSI
jgi:hypothetical protein